MKKIAVALYHEAPQSLQKILAQVSQIVAGTHFAVPIQAPKVKKNTKGRPPTKNAQSKSTKRTPSTFKILEENLKKEQTTKKRSIKDSEQTSKQLKKSVEYEEK
jgi:hypothetical protein